MKAKDFIKKINEIIYYRPDIDENIEILCGEYLFPNHLTQCYEIDVCLPPCFHLDGSVSREGIILVLCTNRPVKTFSGIYESRKNVILNKNKIL